MITKEKFKRYVRVQASGVCNMLSPEVQQLANITEEEHLEIIKNYKKYKTEYGISMKDFSENE